MTIEAKYGVTTVAMHTDKFDRVARSVAAVNGMSEQVGGASAGYKLTPKCSKNRDRLLDGEVASKFLVSQRQAAVVERPANMRLVPCPLAASNERSNSAPLNVSISRLYIASLPYFRH